MITLHARKKSIKFCTWLQTHFEFKIYLLLSQTIIINLFIGFIWTREKKRFLTGFFFFRLQESEITQQEVKEGGCGGLRFWEICEDERKDNERVVCGRSVVGFRGEDRQVLEGSNSERTLPCGGPWFSSTADSYPNPPPSSLASPSSSRLLRKADLCAA